ncbi:MAG: hypothetical protein J6W23_11310 [Victivallales bacterium]|jgi:multidrug resistance efflux pump|nr:hypothetical protein [Victivallales bacterium]
MKEHLLIILLVLATVICSVLCKQTALSNEQLHRQIADAKQKIKEAKKPKVIARKLQPIQKQSVTTTSLDHVENAKLRQEKHVLQKTVAEQIQTNNELDQAINPTFFNDKRRKVTMDELEKIDPSAYADRLESFQAEMMRLHEKMEQRREFLAKMDSSLLSAEENNRLKEYLQLLNRAYEMRLKGEKIPKDMFEDTTDIRQLVEKYSLAAIGSDNSFLPSVQQSLQIWSCTPHYTVLNPIMLPPTVSKGTKP